MASPMRALVLLALLAPTAAGRSLLAHKPNGGSSLHAVAFTSPALNNVNIAVTTAAQTYFVTNGNGTWSTSANSAITQYESVTQISAIGATPGNIGTYLDSAFITSVDFPSATLGIATVGFSVPYASAAMFIATAGVATTGAWNQNPSNPAGVTATFTGATSKPSNPGNPIILTTFDHAMTWQVVTGFGTRPVWKGSGTGGIASPTVNPISSFPNPAVTPAAPSLNNVFCASKGLCFAVGGYGPSLPIVTAPTAAYTPLGYGAAGSVGTYGTVLASTNGGTFWNYATLPLPALAKPSGTLTVGPPGELYSVGVDASGRHVFAVGAPTLPLAVDGNAITCTAGNYAAGACVGGVASYTAPASGTILYSGNSGVSFTAQSAPIVSGILYTLNSVYVIRGTIAFAAGGNPFWATGWSLAATGAVTPQTNTLVTNPQLAPTGLIVATTNGGFSWLVQNIGGFNITCTTSDATSTSATPAGTGKCVTTATGNPSFVPLATQATNTLPVINAVAFTQKGGMYYGWAVGNSGLVLSTTFTSANVSTSSFTPATTWTAVYIPAVLTTSSYTNLYGIVWDNMNVGYIYGSGVILSTHNAGLNWIAETPNPLIITSGINVQAIATVPTSY